MARRRMLDPDFWKDRHVAALTRDERLFLIGCINNADDEGRLEGHPAYLKAVIFMYDDDLTSTEVTNIRDSCLNKMAVWPNGHQYKLVAYQNSGETYLFFPNWYDQQRPSHPSKSKLPPPPPEILQRISGDSTEYCKSMSGNYHETFTTISGETPSQSSIGQSRSGQYSLVKSSAVHEDFTKFSDENDLTDFLTTTLEKYAARGPTWLVEVLHDFWKQTMGSPMSHQLFKFTLRAASKYPAPVLARAYVRAVKYKCGKHSSPKYIERILEEQWRAPPE